MSSLTIRQLTDADIPAAAAILDAAFAPSSWQEGLRLSMQLQSDGMLLAEHDGQPIGLVCAVDYGSFAYVGMMGVRPDAQRQGVARALMGEALAWLDGRGCPQARLDATAVGAPLYEQLGFVDEGRSYVTVGAGPVAPAPLPAGVEPLGPGDIDALAAFDAPIFGADRRAVLAGLAASAPGRVLAVRDAAGALSGYIVAQAHSLGPWAAQTPEIAALLLRAGLACGFAGPPRALIPGGNQGAAAILAAAGMRVQRELRHMRRGRPGMPGDRTALYGLASFAVG